MINKIKNLFERRINELQLIQSEKDLFVDTMRLAAQFIDVYNVWMIDNIFFIKRNGKWIKVNESGDKNSDVLLSEIYRFYASQEISFRKKIYKEVIRLLENKLICPKYTFSKRFVFFKNGYFDLFLDNFFELDSQLINSIPLIKIDIEWKENLEYNNNLTYLINYLSNEKKDIDEFYEIIGALISGYKINKVFLFVEWHKLSKSLFMDLVTSIIGDEFVLQCTFSSLNTSSYRKLLFWKKIIFEEDIWINNELISFKELPSQEIDINIVASLFYEDWGKVSKQLQEISKNLNGSLIIYKLNNKKKFDQEVLTHLAEIKNSFNWLFDKEILFPMIYDSLRSFSKVIKNNFCFSNKETKKYS